GDETLLVPLHAYPATDLQDFPSHVDLRAASLGQRKSISVHCLPIRTERLVCPGKKTRQEKETLFQQVVQQNAAEEEANQLRWQIHRGGDPVTPKQRQRIADDRRNAEEEYQVTSGRPDLQREYKRQSVCTSSQRVLRRAEHHLRVQPQFDLYLNELWANRNRALRRFQQAARKVLIRCRVNRRLGRLRKLLQRLRAERGGDGTFGKGRGHHSGCDVMIGVGGSHGTLYLTQRAVMKK
ncbi:PREDICTED: cilia- and flagella-associated protein 221, partial [Nanorana parkeri]|uniref:cilia- and flagella-associated protein 221 n=1 Tax=Nanorana parkeri TaxID=125878 RepID=UPI0008546686